MVQTAKNERLILNTNNTFSFGDDDNDYMCGADAFYKDLGMGWNIDNIENEEIKIFMNMNSFSNVITFNCIK